MRREQLIEKILDIKRNKGWSWKHITEEIGGVSPILVVGALLGQMKGALLAQSILLLRPHHRMDESRPMSALCPIADIIYPAEVRAKHLEGVGLIERIQANVRFVPIADIIYPAEVRAKHLEAVAKSPPLRACERSGNQVGWR
jgi:hypothetical protein